MGEWAKVVTQPLGLAGFAIFTFLIFFTWRRTSTQPIWVRASFVVMAFTTLLGGLWLAHLNATSRPTAEETSAQQKPLPRPNDHEEISQQKTSGDNKVDQKTTGPGSPAIANTRGDVTITVTNP